MTILSCYVSDETLARLKSYAEWRGDGRTPEQLAEAAIEEAALGAEREQGKRPPLPPARDD
jgi:hypothetical protein